LKRRVKQELLGFPLADNVKAWHLKSDGTYERMRSAQEPPVRNQMEFMKRALQTAKTSRRKNLGAT